MRRVLKNLLVVLLLGVGFVQAYEGVLVESIAPRYIPSNAVRMPVLKISLPKSDEVMKLESIDLSLSGLISHADIDSIWVETPSGIRTNRRSFGADYLVSLPFLEPLFIQKNETLDLFVMMNIQSVVGNSFVITVEDVNSLPLNASLFTQSEDVVDYRTYRSNSYFNTTDFETRLHASKNFSLLCKNSRCQKVYK